MGLGRVPQTRPVPIPTKPIPAYPRGFPDPCYALNQSIPQPSKPETTIPKGTELPLEQPGEQGSIGRNKVASGEGTNNVEWVADATENPYEMVKGEIIWPEEEEADAGVELRASYPKTPA